MCFFFFFFKKIHLSTEPLVWTSYCCLKKITLLLSAPNVFRQGLVRPASVGRLRRSPIALLHPLSICGLQRSSGCLESYLVVIQAYPLLGETLTLNMK